MGKLHRTNAGYLGVSMEETQDPFWTYNKLALGLLDEPGLSVADAGGALPIHATTDRDGAVKGSGTRADSFASYLVLAVAMDGTNGGTTFTDLSATIKGSGSAKSLTRTNAVTSTAQSKYYGSSGLFSGSGAQLSAVNSVDFNMLAGDYTIELWAYQISAAGIQSLVTRGSYGANSGFGLHNVGNELRLYYGNSEITAGSNSLRTGTWQHVAVTQQSGTQRLFVDGMLLGTGTMSRSDNNSDLDIGHASTAWGVPYAFNGYLQDVRIYKGVAKYTASFVPPQASTLALDRSPSRKPTDNKGATWQTGVSKFYGGAVRFNSASSQYISIGKNDDYLFGTGNFCIETWFYGLTSTASIRQDIAGNYTDANTGWGLSLGDGALSPYFYYGNSLLVTAPANSWAINTWNHLAVVRNGSNLTIYINGSSVASATNTTNISSTSYATLVGAVTSISGGAPQLYFNGHLQDFRIYKGIAKYTSSFTPPARSLVQTARRYPSGMHVLS